MKYLVVTTKHHDGFCLWDSKLTGYKAPNTPAKRDLLTPMVEAFREEELKVGFYHSLIDWHHPEFPVDALHPRRNDLVFRAQESGRDVRNYAEYLHGQVRELLTGFGRIDLLFLDFSYSDRALEWGSGKGKADWQSEKLFAMARALMPGILINNRAEVPGDYTTPEQYQPRAWINVDGRPVVWEACQTLNGSWGYDRDNLDWKPVDMLVRMLIDTVSKGGNLILNVGPTARGEFDPRAVATLEGIGAWMRLHDRSISGANQSEFAAPTGCRYTQRGDRLYLHLFEWPFRHVHLEGLKDRVAYAQLLNDGSEIQRYTPPKSAANTTPAGLGDDLLTLVLPVQRPDVAVPVIELFLKA
jgi:alpha-L-fucosidase